MRSVLFINRVYPPESGATGRILEYAAEAFVSAGWRVTILTTTSSGDSGSTLRHGVTVTRVSIAFSKSSLAVRAAGYALMIPRLLIAALTAPRADVVITMTDPPMLAVIGPVLRFSKGSGLLHWAQDLYPEVAEEAGVIRKKGIVAAVLRAVSTLALRLHHRVASPGRCLSERLIAKGISREIMTLVPNIGMERDIISFPGTLNEFRTLHGIDAGTLVVMYSGNLGMAHEFSTVLQAARFLQERGEQGILFLFVGEGPSRPKVESDARAAGLSNVRFLPSQPLERVSVCLGAADLHLVTMREGMSGVVVPSKFYGVLAAGRPCLFVGPRDTEVAAVIREVGCGSVVENDAGERLADVILSYRRQPGRSIAEGGKGIEWLRGQDDAATRLLRIVEEMRG